MKTYWHGCTVEGVKFDVVYTVEDNCADLNEVYLDQHEDSPDLFPLLNEGTIAKLQQAVELDWANRCADPRDSRED